MTDDTHVWSETYQHATEAFGQMPRPEDEATILEHWERNPELIITLIDQVARDVHSGKAKWGWSTLAARLQRGPVRDSVVTGAGERKRREHAAEIWIRHAGLYFDRETEIEDELFGATGLLHAYSKDPELRERMIELYRAERPRGETAEQASLDHQAQMLANREALKQMLADAKAKRIDPPEPPDDQPAPDPPEPTE